MKRRFVCILGFAVASLCTIQAGELVWHPLVGSELDEIAHIGTIGQIGSEVHLSVALPFDQSSCDLHSDSIPVEFPTLFVVSCKFGLPKDPDIVIYNHGRTIGSYDYEVGDGWILHRKGFGWCKPVTESLGWIYIKQYPWVYTLDGGWRYVVEAGIFEYSNAWWFYEPDYGWYWSTRDLYPIIYHKGVGWTTALPGRAAQFGNFTYVEYAAYIEITDYPEHATGDVNIPSEIVGKPVTSIGEWAFAHCSSLTNLTIPDSVTSIGEGAFASCNSLTNPTIGSGVTSIGEEVFSNCRNLTSIAIPESVTSIGYRAFRGCRNLASITIGNAVTSIGKEAFFDCRILSSVTIPDSVTSIGQGAFSNCTSLTGITIPDSVTSIGSSAFTRCTSLTGVTIPVSVTSIGSRPFFKCTSLTAITVNAANPAFSSVDGVLFDKKQTTLLQYPWGKAGAYTIPDSVNTIAQYGFRSCPSLTSVTIGRGLTSIRRSAFWYCENLTTVTIPGSVTSIEDSAFYTCTSLTSVTIGRGVMSIGEDTFHRCTSLTSVTIPDSVTSIGEGAFGRCFNLTVVVFEGNAPNVTSTSFEHAYNATVYYLAGTTGWGATYGGLPTRLTTGVDPLIGGLNLDGIETWFDSGWFGSYSTAFAPWLFHIDHGFIYRYSQSSDASMYFYDMGMLAWWWTSSDIYPWIYAFDPSTDTKGTDIESAWLEYDKNTGSPRFFYVQTGDLSEITLYYDP